MPLTNQISKLNYHRWKSIAIYLISTRLRLKKHYISHICNCAKTKCGSQVSSVVYYNDEIHHARKLRGVNEKIWRKTRLEIHRQISVEHRNTVNTMIHLAKCDISKLDYLTAIQRPAFESWIYSLFKNGDRKLPRTSNMNTMCSDFAVFFSGKVDA